MTITPRILFLVHDDYAALKMKGVDHMILERDENGFFEKVVTVHPLACKKQLSALNSRHMLYEFSLRNCFYPNYYGLLLPLFPIKFLFMVMALLWVIRKEKINVIRATDPYLMGLIGWVLSRLSGIPFCISLHTDYESVFSIDPQKGFKQFLRKCAKWMPDFVSPRAQLILPISYYIKKVVSKRVAEEKIKVIPHGIDFNFTPIENIHSIFKLPVDKKIISYVARLSKDNYVDDILLSMEKLSSIRDDFILVMIGGGELEPYIHQWLAQRPHMKTFIRLLGFQPNHIGRSMRYVSTISLCLMSGFSLIEAAAARSPMISYDIEWHNELVQSHVTGFLIPEHDISALMQAIGYLLDHPDKANLMGQNARELAYQNHDIKKTSLLKQHFYATLLNIECVEQ